MSILPSLVILPGGESDWEVHPRSSKSGSCPVLRQAVPSRATNPHQELGQRLIPTSPFSLLPSFCFPVIASASLSLSLHFRLVRLFLFHSFSPFALVSPFRASSLGSLSVLCACTHFSAQKLRLAIAPLYNCHFGRCRPALSLFIALSFLCDLLQPITLSLSTAWPDASATIEEKHQKLKKKLSTVSPLHRCCPHESNIGGSSSSPSPSPYPQHRTL